jgi:Ferritin-like
MVEKVRVPTDADVLELIVGGRDQLSHLLAEASEIEHTLMCTYLYAAFSLNAGGQAQFSGEEAAAIERWRAAILSVAIDEMVHLLLVANLSIAIGARPHFSRLNFPIPSGSFPADVVVKLTGFSPATLAHFIYLERPQGYELNDGEGFEPRKPYRREESFHGIMPSVQDYATVGDLYDAIAENVKSCAARLGEKQLFVGPVDAQIGPDVIELDGVMTVADQSSALRAIETIVEQGEGSRGDREESHFHRFCRIRDEYEVLRRHNPHFEPAWPVAESPVMRRPPEPADKVFVSAMPAAQVLDFANATYATMLQLIVQAFGRSHRDVKRETRRHLDAAIGLMRVLSRVSSALSALPASDEHRGVNAGVSFTVTRAVEPFFVGSAESVLVMERLQDLLEGARGVGQSLPSLADLPRIVQTLRDRYSQQ